MARTGYWDKEGQSESGRHAWDRAVRLFEGIHQETGRQGEMEGDTPTARLGSGLVVSGSQVGLREEAC